VDINDVGRFDLSGARTCEPFEPVNTTKLELEQRDVNPSGLCMVSRSNLGGAAGLVAGVIRHPETTVISFLTCGCQTTPARQE